MVPGNRIWEVPLKVAFTVSVFEFLSYDNEANQSDFSKDYMKYIFLIYILL